MPRPMPAPAPAPTIGAPDPVMRSDLTDSPGAPQADAVPVTATARSRCFT